MYMYCSFCIIKLATKDSGALCIIFLTRMCAKEALADVVKYLNEKEGQVAVSEALTMIMIWYTFVTLLY